MIRIIAIAICFLGFQAVTAQNEAPEIPPKIIPEYHFNLAYATNIKPEGIQHIEVGLNKDLVNVFNNKLRLGLGVRLGIQDSKNPVFTSAHASIKGDADNLDTLFADRVQSAGFNFYFNGEYIFAKHQSFGLTLDLLGISAGLNYDAVYLPGVTSRQYGYYTVQDVEMYPTASNAFSFGNAKGNLNTQLYYRIELSRKLSFRIGASYLYQEFSTDEG